MKPWDTKLTHELSQHEMCGFVDHLQRANVFESERHIKEVAEIFLKLWTEDRGRPQWERQNSDWRFSLHVRINGLLVGRWFSENATLPPMRDVVKVVVVVLPEWLKPEEAEYLCDMQLREQLYAGE